MPQTSEPLIRILEAIETETSKLSDAAGMMEVSRSFTLDGRLVGDIGEMLAAQHLEITLDESQRRGHDGITSIGGVDRDVQIKCRKAATQIEFSTVPDLLVIIEFANDWSSWEIVYNGDGSPVREAAVSRGKTVDAEGRIQVNKRRSPITLTINTFRTAENSSPESESVPKRPAPLDIFTAGEPVGSSTP